MEERELRQYFNDLYGIFLGSAMKNGHALNPSDILKATEIHWKSLVDRLKEIKMEQI